MAKLKTSRRRQPVFPPPPTVTMRQTPTDQGMRMAILDARARLRELEVAYLNRLFTVVDTTPRRFPVA